MHAAEKAATGVMELAERSTRISLDVDIKAPLVFLPQSSTSRNVIVADFGRITVKNHFTMVPSVTYKRVPPVIDVMMVDLSDLKMFRCEIIQSEVSNFGVVFTLGSFGNVLIHVYPFSRTTFEEGKFQTEIQLLKPVNLDLSVERNLSSSWYHSVPDIEIKAHLKPMNVSWIVLLFILWLVLLLSFHKTGHTALAILF